MAGNTNANSPPGLPFITRFKLFLLKLVTPLYTRRDGTINRRILSLFDFKASAPATKLICTTRVSTLDITVDATRSLWFRIFNPSMANDNSPSPQSLPLIVYYHGGGFTNYGPDSKPFDDLCTQIAARMPAVVASINYRLAPEHRYPTQYEDAYEAFKFIDSQSYRILPVTTDLKKCFVAGDSAGGNIAHHVTVRACQNSHEFNEVKIQGLMLLQPFFGGEERAESELRLMRAPMLNVERTDWMWSCFLPEGADRDHPAARVFGGGSNIKVPTDLKSIEFPRVLVIAGGYDPLQDWQKQYVEWLKNCGKQVESIDYPKAFHGFYAFPEVPEHNLLISDASNFIEKAIHMS